MPVKINYNNNWSGGYTNFRDISNMPITEIAGGSQNVKCPDGDKWEPRGGSSYFGVQGTNGVNTDPYWVSAHRIHSAQHTFVNKQGITIPLRVFYSGTSAQGDVIEAWLPIYDNSGNPTDDKQWYQITANAPSSPIISTHRYYWAEWFDQALSVVQPELLFTYGGNEIGNWSGGFAPVTAVTATTITTNGIWSAKGFIGAPEGTNVVVVNGVQYTVTLGFGTDTITVASTAGISVGDVVFQSVYFNDTLGGNTIYDVCSTINNQVYYLDWNQRNVYISWNRNQVQSLSTTIYAGSSGLDDANFSGTYTGTTTDRYQVSIDTTSPDIDTQEFIPGGDGNLNDGVYDTSGYSGTAGDTNVYTVSIIADVSIGYSPTAGFVLGEAIKGGTSSAEGIIVARQTVGAGEILGIKMLTSTSFEGGEAITGASSGTVTNITGSVTYDSWFQYSKNGTIVNVNTGFGSFPYNILFAGGAITLSDGLTITFSTVNGHAVGDTFKLTIRTGGVDTFSWTLDGATQASRVPITGAAQLLSQGVSITFANENGHEQGDTWATTASPTVIRGWSQFWYDQPNRLPGQGFTLLLDSNGWTMKPQENTMYINSKSGHYYTVNLQLSSDLQNESVTIQRLKSEPQNRALYPYYINYIKNQFAVISMDKTYDVLGRQKFLELPQMKSISDAVRVDFVNSDWEDGDILYFKRKFYFSLPKENKFFVFDDYKKYWQAPDRWAKKIGLLAVIDDKLIGHSYERNESYELYTSDLNDLADPDNDFPGYPIETKIVYAYQAFGDRYLEKASAFAGFEGYISGAPELRYLINFNIGGCGGQVNRVIDPLLTKSGLCIPQDTSSLGKGSLGSHGLGNDPIEVPNHFLFIDFFNNYTFFQRNIEVSCNSLDQRWALVSVGTDVIDANMNNSDIINRVL